MDTLETQTNALETDPIPDKRPSGQKTYDSQYKQILIPAGLEPDQALIYEILLKSGPLKAGKISQKAGLKRGLTYKILDELADLGLVVKNEQPKIALFEPAHPMKLREIAENQETKIKIAQAALEGAMAQLTSNYNLAVTKPGVQFYEGHDGVKKVADDSLTSKTEILSYLDNEAINKYIPDINQEYIQKRNRMKIAKRMIAVDSQYVRDRAKQFNKSTTHIRVIDKGYPFATVMQIYDGKVSYITLDDKKMIGLIIADPHIYQMHKILFELTWEKSTPITQVATSAPASA